MGITKERIEELTREHGRIRVVETAAGTLVFRKPTRPEWRKFQTAAESDQPGAGTLGWETLVLDTIASHTREELASLLDEYVGLAGDKGVGIAIRELAGVVRSEEGKG